MPIVTRVIILSLMFLVAAGTGAYWQRGRDAKAYNALTAEFARFRGAVDGTARERAAANARQALADLKAKERADEEHDRRLAAVRARIDELRLANDSARSGGWAAAPADTRCPEGQTCFESDAFERAHRELVEEIRRLADEGTAVSEALGVAREWARRLAP